MDSKKNHIIKINLDQLINHKYHDPFILDEYIRGKIVDDKMHYIILDEIQLVSNFESLLHELLFIFIVLVINFGLITYKHILQNKLGKKRQQTDIRQNQFNTN